MSFNGTPIFEQISPSELRITGLSLNANTAGTLGFSDAGGASPALDVRLPDTFLRPSVTFNGTPVALAAAVKVDIAPESAGPLTNLPPSIQKTGEGVDFRITITNTKVDLTTQTLEIYLTLLGLATVTDNIVINVSNSPHTEITLNFNTPGV